MKPNLHFFPGDKKQCQQGEHNSDVWCVRHHLSPVFRNANARDGSAAGPADWGLICLRLLEVCRRCVRRWNEDRRIAGVALHLVVAPRRSLGKDVLTRALLCFRPYSPCSALYFLCRRSFTAEPPILLGFSLNVRIERISVVFVLLRFHSADLIRLQLHRVSILLVGKFILNLFPPLMLLGNCKSSYNRCGPG